MVTRLLETPEQSILLLGPRGTGKTTWIHQHFHDAVYYDLLNTSEALRFSREPGALFREVESEPPGRWIVIDEVQKVPALLDPSSTVERLSKIAGCEIVMVYDLRPGKI